MQGKGKESNGGWEAGVYSRVSEGNPGKVPFEKKSEGSVCVGAVQKSGPDSRRHECKGLEIGVCLTCWRHSNETVMAGSETMKSSVLGMILER